LHVLISAAKVSQIKLHQLKDWSWMDKLEVYLHHKSTRFAGPPDLWICWARSRRRRRERASATGRQSRVRREEGAVKTACLSSTQSHHQEPRPQRYDERRKPHGRLNPHCSPPHLVIYYTDDLL
jgi:hypothetical protein